MSYHEDDESFSVYSFEAGDDVNGVTEVIQEDALKVEAENAQRLGLLRNQAEYVTGSLELCMGVNRKLTPEKMFHLPKLYSWERGEPSDLLADLATRRVRARLQAAMGVGKSTRLASIIADGLSMRVLVVGPNAHGLRQNSEYVRAAGIGRYRRDWAKNRESRVCCMTYADFCGFHMNERPGDLYKAFDLIVFDEGFEDRRWVFCAKKAFAVYASENVNLLVCSATISSDVGASASAANTGTFKLIDPVLPLEEMMRSEKLVTDYLVDRTLVVLPTDVEVQEAYEYYQAYGLDVIALDSASTYNDLLETIAALRGDAVTPRVVVAHCAWALGFNLELEFAVGRPVRAAWVEQEGVWREVQYAMSEEYVSQMKARTGRGIGATSGGVVVGAVRERAVDLHQTEVEASFFILLAMHIVPNRVGRYADCYAKYPRGFSPAVAYTVLTVNLPAAVAVRYLAEDGRVAAKYARALSMFTHVDRYHLPSKHEEPVNYGRWVEDSYSNHDVDTGEVVTESHQRVPVRAQGELQIVLHAISAVAEGRIVMDRWRPPRMSAIGDAAVDAEAAVSTRRPKMRRAEVVEVEPVPEDEVVTSVLQLQLGDPLDEYGRPVQRLIPKARMKEALRTLDGYLRDSVMPSVQVEPVEHAGGTFVDVPAFGDVNGASGELVCSLPVVICEKLNNGAVLTIDEFFELLRIVRRKEQDFVQSRVFDGFAHPWTSVLHTVLAPDHLPRIVRAGEWQQVYDMLSCMRKRFEVELCVVLSRSNVTRSSFARLFRKRPKPADLMARIFAGDFAGIGQSDGFFRRVMELKRLQDGTLVAADRAGLYLADQVSSVQRAPGLGGRQVVGAGSGRWEPIAPEALSVVQWEFDRPSLLARLSGRGRRR